MEHSFYAFIKIVGERLNDFNQKLSNQTTPFSLLSSWDEYFSLFLSPSLLPSLPSPCPLYSIFAVLEIGPRASGLPGKYSTTKPHTQTTNATFGGNSSACIQSTAALEFLDRKRLFRYLAAKWVSGLIPELLTAEQAWVSFIPWRGTCWGWQGGWPAPFLEPSESSCLTHQQGCCCSCFF